MARVFALLVVPLTVIYLVAQRTPEVDVGAAGSRLRGGSDNPVVARLLLVIGLNLFE